MLILVRFMANSKSLEDLELFAFSIEELVIAKYRLSYILPSQKSKSVFKSLFFIFNTFIAYAMRAIFPKHLPGWVSCRCLSVNQRYLGILILRISYL